MNERIPPQATDLEETVLGAMMLESNSIINVSGFLKPEMFYRDSHQKIYSAILSLDKKSEPIDMLTVTNYLNTRGELESVGGPYAIAQLTSRVGSSANLESHGRIIYEKWASREIIRVCMDAVTLSYDGSDFFEVISSTVSQVESLVSFNSNDISATTRMSKTREYVYKAHGSDNGLGGVSTGYATFDQFTGGLIPGDLIVVGGLPGAFKTALMLSIEHNVAAQGVPVLMFEQEMSDEQTGIREVARESGLPVDRLKSGNLSQEEMKVFEQTISTLEGRSVYVDTTSGINTGYIRSISRRYVRDKGVGLIVVDYLQLMDEDNKKTQEQAIDTTVKTLKILAKQLKVPVILLSAFNDNAYRDTTTPPKANSLKGSRAIGAHADIVIFLWNPSKDSPGFVYHDPQRGEIETTNKLGIIFDKNRQGSPGLLWLGVEPATNRFYDLNVNDF